MWASLLLRMEEFVSSPYLPWLSCFPGFHCMVGWWSWWFSFSIDWRNHFLARPRGIAVGDLLISFYVLSMRQVLLKLFTYRRGVDSAGLNLDTFQENGCTGLKYRFLEKV